MSSHRLNADPFYRQILAELADTEWQIVEQNFRGAVARGEVRITVQGSSANVASSFKAGDGDEPTEQGKG